MASQADYDFVLQLSCDVLRNVQTRVINASLLTNLALTSPISRVLAQTITPFQMKAHWAKPELDIAKQVVKLSADVQGGARYAVKGINLTMEGQVNVKCRPTAVANDDGQPVVTLATPSPLELHLGDLKLSYEGDDELPTWVDTAIEHTLLRPTLSTQLMAPLSNLPLNCLPDAVPLRLIDDPEHLGSPTDGLTLTNAAVSLDQHAESLTLGMRCTAHTAAPAPPPNLLSERATANAAVALSETGLNRILDWLCAHDLATGTTQRANGPVSWRWAHAAASFTDHAIHLTGQLWQGETATVVEAATQCSLTSSAQLSVQLTAPEPQPLGAAVLIDAWTHLLRCTFYAATGTPEPAHPPGAEPDSDQPLLQRFVIPGTDLSTEALAVDLRLRHEYLVALYAIPPDEQPFTLTLEEKNRHPPSSSRSSRSRTHLAPRSPHNWPPYWTTHRSRPTTTPGAPTKNPTPVYITARPSP